MSASTDSRGVPKPSRPSRPRGRPVGDHQAKISVLLAAARYVLATEGYAGTSIRKVAKRAASSMGAVTYYFKSKDAMMAAVANSLFDEFDEWVADGEGPSGIRAFLERMFTWTTVHQYRAWSVTLQLVLQAGSDAALASVIRKRDARLRAAAANLIRKGQTEGTIRRDLSAEAISDQLGALTDGWIMMLPIEPNRFSKPRMRGLIDEVMLLIGPSM